MFRTRVLPLLAALCLLLPLGVNAAEVDSGDVYCFSPEDFSSEEKELKGICITEVPGKTGQVLLGSRVIRPGDTLSADRLAELTFAPANTEADADAQVGYLPIYAGEVGPETTMTLAIRGKENKAPVAEDSALETYKNLENTGKLKVRDPEGEPMTFTVVRQPKRGSVTIGEDGSFTYTPKKNKVGIDSFTYTAADASGKVSREATVTITILKPTESTQYTDTTGKSCCFAAEWMKNTGIFTGESLAGKTCFGPEKTVSRGEFLTMCMELTRQDILSGVSSTGFADDGDIPGWQKPYVATALMNGAITGYTAGGSATFAADEPVTCSEAAVMLNSVLSVTDVASYDTDEGTPVWAGQAVANLNACRILPESYVPNASLTRAQAARMLSAALEVLAAR